MQKAHWGHIWHARGANEQTKQEPQPTQQHIGATKTRKPENQITTEGSRWLKI